MPDSSSPPLQYHVFDPERQEIRVITLQPPVRRYWLHALLFLATIFTTLCIGARLQFNFNHNLPAFSTDADYWPWRWVLADWRRLLLGIPFSATLLGILTAHEFGHFIFCVRRRVYATLPFFVPAPTLIGTLGAFIRIQSPISSRSDLFDIGIAGPIAGFILGLPLLVVGLMLSKPLTAAAAQSDISFGVPLIFSFGHWFLSAFVNANGSIRLDALNLSPVAIAAWVGMFATALNLLPGGQLDGGHIIFAVKPRLHRRISTLSILVLLVLSWYCWAGWLLWAVVLRITGSRHPDVPYAPALDRKRLWLAGFALLMLVVTFAPAPVKQRDDRTGQQVNGSLQNMLDDYRTSHSQHSPSK